MLEQAVLQGKALLLLEFPSRFKENESMLRDFFLLHFDRTPASQIKAVQFTPNKNTEGQSLESTHANGEVIVEFFATEGVQLVLSRIIQHELFERDEINHLELRRGFVYFGRDRLLVEGVVHLPQSPSTMKVEHVDMHNGCLSAAQRKEGEGQGLKNTNTTDSINDNGNFNIDNSSVNTSNSVSSKSLAEGGQHGSNEDEEDDKDSHKEKKGEKSEDMRRSLTKDDVSCQQASLSGAVVLCMNFLCTYNRYNNLKNEHSYDDENNSGITPHVIYQLLRDTCFVRKVVIFRYEKVHIGSSDVKRRMTRALVEVGDEEEAKNVVNAFHETTLELACSGLNVNDVEYRYKVYAHYNGDLHTHRQLTVPVNTKTALSVTPHNLAMMGPMFQRQKYLCATNDNDEKKHNLPREHRFTHNEHQHRNDLVMRHNNNSNNNSNDATGGYEHHHGRRRRERSSGRRRWSHSGRLVDERVTSTKRHRQAFEHNNSIHRDTERDFYRAQCEKDDALRRSEGEAKTTYESQIHQWRQWQQAQQQSINYAPSNGLRCVDDGTIKKQSVKEGPLPHGWRAVYSSQYQKVYYVFRDPVTGVEKSSWEPTLMN